MSSSLPRTVWLARHVLPHEPALRAWLRRRRVGGLEVDDIIQETYAVLSGLAAVDHIQTPKAYAFQIAQSVILRHLRRARTVRIEAFRDIDLLTAAVDEPSPEQHAASREELGKVIELIADLPAKCREAFVLRKVEGLSQREVARAMGISESTVEKHISRGLRVLTAAFRDGDQPYPAAEPRGFAGFDGGDAREAQSPAQGVRPSRNMAGVIVPERAMA